jgi:hypothetical protein
VTDENDLQEQLEELKAKQVELENQLAQQQYGGAAASAGIGSGLRAPQPEAWDLVLERLRRGDGLGDSGGKLAFARGIGKRLAEAAEFAVRTPSYRSFSRNGADDKQIRDDRLSRRSKQGGSL